MNFTEVSRRYQQELDNNVIPFWEEYSPDGQYGGYFTCLDRDGSVYDTTKYLWMQWRIVYMFADLAKNSGNSSAWIDTAISGYNFLTAHGKADDGNYYFAVTQDGTPAIAPYNVYTEYFAALGAAALSTATGEEAHRAEALASAERYLTRLDNPKGRWEKKLSGWPQRRTLGHSMMLLNLWDALEEHLQIVEHRKDAENVIDEILEVFWNPEFGIIFENVDPDGGFDTGSQEGRHLNPGHALEALWFIMDYSLKHNLSKQAEQAAQMVLPTLEFSWDSEYGGIRYFMDALAKPHVELQADMKLWWVHCEASLALLYAFLITGSTSVVSWFERLDRWTWDRFPDSEYKEWYGYLDRAGKPSHTLKGGKWKTFFHLPRFLQVGQHVIDKIVAK